MRYFFVIIRADGSTIDDKTGVDCLTEFDAVVFGRSVAHDLAAEGDQYIGGSVFIRREKGRHVERVAIRERDKPAARLNDRVGFFGSIAADRTKLSSFRP